MADGDRLGLVGDGDVDDAVRHLHRHRADLLGPEHAEAAALDHRRAAHADVRVRGRDDDVAAAEQRGVAGEAAPRVDADQRHEAAESRPKQVRTPCSRGRPRPAVGVAGPAAAALGEEHDRQPQPLGELEQPVLLAVVLRALRAGEHGVVVGHDHAARAGRRRTGRRSPCRCPATRPSAGVRSMRSSSGRRRRCAAITSGPYSTKVPGSQRSSTFSRAVRWPVLRRRATASGRASSSADAWRSSTSARSGRMWSRSTSSAAAVGAPRRPSPRRRARAGRGPRTTVSPRPRRAARHHAAHVGARRRAPSSSPPSPASGWPGARPGRPSPTSTLDDRALQRRHARRPARRPGSATVGRGAPTRWRRPCRGASTASGSSASTRAPARPAPPVAAAPVADAPGSARPAAATSSATCSSTKRVVDSPGRRRRGGASTALQERDVGRDALDAELAERPAGPLRAPRPDRRRRAGDHLGEQRVEARARRVAGVAARVDAHAGPGRAARTTASVPPAGRTVPSASHRLDVDAHLDREAARRRHGVLRQAELGERRAAGEAQLGLHEVDAGHLLGDGVLDLEPRVGLDERVAAPSARRRRRGTRTCRGSR